MSYENELKLITVAMLEASKRLLEVKPAQIDQKSEFDLVTNMDRETETFLSEAIKAVFPDDKILGEEWSSTEEISGRTWTIDPIDGTVNFAHGSPLFGIQCALIDENELVLGAIYLPHLNELYTAVKGEGCYLNGKRVYADSEAKLSGAIVSFGDYSHTSDEKAVFQHEIIRKLYPQIAKIRMFGAACMDFAFAASGKTNGTVIMTRNLWDLLPGVILCREAGAEVRNLQGEPYQIGDYGVITASGETAEALWNLLAEIKNDFSC